MDDNFLRALDRFIDECKSLHMEGPTTIVFACPQDGGTIKSSMIACDTVFAHPALADRAKYRGVGLIWTS